MGNYSKREKIRANKVHSLKLVLALILTGVTLIMVIGIELFTVFHTRSNNKKQVEKYCDKMLLDIQTEMKYAVELARSSVEQVYSYQESGKLTEEEAREIAADQVRKLRYNDGAGYFWIDTTEGINVVQLGDQRIEGTNRYEDEDPNGVKYIKDIIRVAESGGGYCYFEFPKPGEEVPSPNMTYSLEFEPYQWVIGTAVWIDSIDQMRGEYEKEAEKSLKKSLTLSMMVLFAAMIAELLILMYLLQRFFLSKTEQLAHVMQSYAKEKDVSVVIEDIREKFSGQDELSALGQQFVKLIVELEDYMGHLVQARNDLEYSRVHAAELSELARKDALTGLRNKTAYDDEVKKISWEILNGEKQFGVAMVDLNFLKRINDTFGHDKGNLAIQKLSKIICQTFAHSPVFRIGGDEFAVILKGNDMENIRELEAEFNRQVQENSENEKLDYWERTSAALGYALYDEFLDEGYDNVFKRADKAMYERKKKMRGLRRE